MLHLTIICIVCAIFTPSEGNALIGLKYNECHLSCHFDERCQRPGGSSTPRPCNINFNEFANCANQRNTSKIFFYNYLNKQYQDKKSNYCNCKKNFPQRKEENYFSNTNLGFKTRKLLWTNKVREDIKKDYSKMGNKKNKKYYKKLKWRSSCEEKTNFFQNVKHKRGKRNVEKRHLDKVEIDDELDIDKRIKKLIKRVSMGNMKTEKSSDLIFESLTETTQDGSGFINPSTVYNTETHESIPFLKNIKRVFRFTKEYFTNNKGNGDTYISSVSSTPVTLVLDTLRGKNSLPNFNNHITSQDTLKNLKKRSTRFRRNLEKIFISKYPYKSNGKYKEKLNLKLGDDNLFKTKNFLHPHYNPLYPKNKRNGQNWMLSKRSYFNDLMPRNRRQGIYKSKLKQSDQTTARNLIEFEEQTTKGLGLGPFDRKKIHQKIVEKDILNYEENLGEKEKKLKILPLVRKGVKETRESSISKNSEEVPNHILEKPMLETNFNDIDWKDGIGNSNIEKFTSMTGVPPNNFPIYKNYKYKLPNDKNLTPTRYLQIRHALRNFLIHNEVWSPKKRSFAYQRVKRYGSGNTMPHKCWRSAPLLCIPYIRKGQDELLKYIIKTLQKMLGKPFSQKIDIFEKTKYKPNATKRPETTCEEIMPNDEEIGNESVCSRTPDPCKTPSTTICIPPTTSSPLSTTTCTPPKTPSPLSTTSCIPPTSSNPFSTTACIPPTSSSSLLTTTCIPPTSFSALSTIASIPPTSSSPLSTTTCIPLTSPSPPSTTSCIPPTSPSHLPITTSTHPTTPYPLSTTTYTPSTTSPPSTTSYITSTTPSTLSTNTSIPPTSPSPPSTTTCTSLTTPHPRLTTTCTSPTTPCPRSTTTCTPPTTPSPLSTTPSTTTCTPPAIPCPVSTTTCSPFTTPCSVLTTPCSPPTTPCPLLTTTCPPPIAPCPVLTTTCPPPIAPCPVLTTTCSSPTTPCPVLTTTCTPPTTPCPVSTTTCPPLITPCPEPTIICSPPTTPCPPPTTPPTTSCPTIMICHCPITPRPCPTTPRPCATTPRLCPTTPPPCPTTSRPCPTIPRPYPTTSRTSPTTPRPFSKTPRPSPITPQSYSRTTPKSFETTSPCTPYPTTGPFAPKDVETTMTNYIGITWDEKFTSVNSHAPKLTTVPDYYSSINPTPMSVHPTPYISHPAMKMTTPVWNPAPTLDISSTSPIPLFSRSPQPFSTSLHTPPSPFSVNAWSWNLSKSPYEPEYFSFTYIPLSETCSSGSCQPPKTISQNSIHQQPLNVFNQRPQDQKHVSYSLYSANMENNAPELTTMNYIALSDSVKYDLQDINKFIPPSDSEKEQKSHFTENFLENDKTNVIKKKTKKLSELNDNYNSNDFGFKNHNFQQDESMKHELHKNKESFHERLKQARRHKGSTKNHYKSFKEFPIYDNDFYNKYPFMRSADNLKYVKYPIPWFSNSGYNRKIRKKSKKTVSKRQKRGDNYLPQTPNPNIYYDLSHNLNDNEQPDSFFLHSNIEELSAITDRSMEKDSDMIPPSYALFSELAMAVTSTDNTTANGIQQYTTSDTQQSTTKNKKQHTKKHTSTNSQTQNVANSNVSTNANKKNFKHQGTTQMSDIFMGRRKYVKGKKSSTTFDVQSTTPVNGTNTFTTSLSSAVSTYSSTTALSSAMSTTFDCKKSVTTISPLTMTTETISFQLTNVSHTKASLTDVKSSGQSLGKYKTEIGKLTKETNRDPETKNIEDGQTPTTLKFASIVKGPKKLLAKPSPKSYTKVYPDSLPNEGWSYEITTKTSLTPKPAIDKTTPVQASAVPDVRLQLLAVCEGYLEVVKLIKVQNQSLGEEIDADLSRYCENIISQSFNLPSDCVLKQKKNELIPSILTSSSKPNVDATPKSSSNLYSKLKFDCSKPTKEINDHKHRSKILVDILSSPVYKRELAVKVDKVKRSKIKKSKGTGNTVKYEGPVRKKKMYQHKSRQIKKGNKKRARRNEEIHEELLKKGMSEEQVELLDLLRKRKRALLWWLFNSKEDQVKPYDVQETEYFDDDDDEFVTHFSKHSGKIKPKASEETSIETSIETPLVNETIFPIYAKQYGYDRGGELTEVEVLWRKFNEKTQERKILKNQSILALLLTSTIMPNIKQENTKYVGNNAYENEEVLEVQSKSDNKVGFAESLLPFRKRDVTTEITDTISSADNSSENNETYTVLNKPDLSSIVATPPNATTELANTTQKPSHKLGAAKDLFQEYTIEFLNYAVYILPIMFTILFLFCCMCCFLQIIKTKKRNKKKKRRDTSTESDTGSTEELELGRKKKKRDKSRKKHLKNDKDVENIERKRSKTLWKVLKLNSRKPSSEFNEENEEKPDKKRSFLRYLKGKKGDQKSEEPYSGALQELDVNVEEFKNDEKKHSKGYDDSDEQSAPQKRVRENTEKKIDDQTEAKERRELIALLEEIKKIETENVAEKKEHKSVYVQYMTQKEDESILKSPDNSNSYQRCKYFPMPRAYPFCSKHFPKASAIKNYELYEDVEEMTELIPCEYNYSKKKDPTKHTNFQINREGTCERFFKIFRDSGVIHKPVKEFNFMKSGSGDKSYIFNKYRSISTDTSDELMGGTRENTKTLTDNMFENVEPFSLPPKRKNELMEDMENFKRQISKKKYVRLKDDGVLCRL